MKEIVVISGKGGTGKTSITASFALIAGNGIVVADCDVDAADMHLLMDPDFADATDFTSGELAVIDQDRCSRCGKCARICRFNAIDMVDGRYGIDPASCEGCAYCSRVCPESAITMEPRHAGKLYISTTKADGPMVHAALATNAENSGRLVAHVKNEAKRIAGESGREIVLVDGSPGIGCPVVSSLSGADYIVIVTEPTVSGFHDLKRINELRNMFHISAGCIINKSDLNREIAEKISRYLKQENIGLIGTIPYDENFTKAMIHGKAIVEYEGSEAAQWLADYWRDITEELQKKEALQ